MAYLRRYTPRVHRSIENELQAALRPGVSINVGGTWIKPTHLTRAADYLAANDQAIPDMRQLPLFIHVVPKPAQN